MSRTQENIAYGVGAGLAAATVFTATALVLFYHVTLIPSAPNTYNGGTTTTSTQSPPQPDDSNLAALSALAVMALFSLLTALYFALRYARDEITIRQRLLAATSGVAGMLAAANVVAIPIGIINLSHRHQVSLGVMVGVIAPAFLAVYSLLSYGAYRLYVASRQQPDSNGLNRLFLDAEEQRRRDDNSETAGTSPALPQITASP